MQLPKRLKSSYSNDLMKFITQSLTIDLGLGLVSLVLCLLVGDFTNDTDEFMLKVLIIALSVLVSVADVIRIVKDNKFNV